MAPRILAYSRVLLKRTFNKLIGVLKLKRYTVISLISVVLYYYITVIGVIYDAYSLVEICCCCLLFVCVHTHTHTHTAVTVELTLVFVYGQTINFKYKTIQMNGPTHFSTLCDR